MDVRFVGQIPGKYGGVIGIADTSNRVDARQNMPNPFLVIASGSRISGKKGVFVELRTRRSSAGRRPCRPEIDECEDQLKLALRRFRDEVVDLLQAVRSVVGNHPVGRRIQTHHIDALGSQIAGIGRAFEFQIVGTRPSSEPITGCRNVRTTLAPIAVASSNTRVTSPDEPNVR